MKPQKCAFRTGLEWKILNRDVNAHLKNIDDSNVPDVSTLCNLDKERLKLSLRDWYSYFMSTCLHKMRISSSRTSR